MDHAKTKVAISCLLKADCTKEMSPESMYQLKKGHIKLSPCTFSSAGLSLSLSLSNMARIYWNVVVILLFKLNISKDSSL